MSISGTTVTNIPASYVACTGPFATVATPTDVFTISGSATTTVRVRRVILTSSQTTAGQARVLFIKRSTADSGGTSATATNVPVDSAQPAATAVVRSYTANPTGLGTAVGNVRDDKVFIAAPATVWDDTYIWDFTGTDKKGIVLRGVAESLCMNFASVTLTGGSLNVTVEFTEES